MFILEFTFELLTFGVEFYVDTLQLQLLDDIILLM